MLLLRTPRFPDEVGLINPGLVDVDDPLLTLESFNHFHGKLLPQDQAAL